MTEPLLDGDPVQIGPYRLHARLGGGGMGQVFLGRSRGGRTVAVKVVRPELAQDPDFRHRFATEVAAARRVGGFYTAQVVDADTDANPPWLATAYIPGPSLHQAVRRHGPLPPASVAVLGAGLAEGLMAVHARDLVHRDLKPDNVILAQDGPRLIDFGIARAMDSPTYTAAQPVIGTIGFMSPEQARGHEVAPPSDVFALGCVLAFAATGRNPFGEGSVHAMIYRVVHEEPDLSGLPRSLVGLVGDCLVKAPDARPGLERVLEELAAPTHSTRPHDDGRWLPEAITEVIARRTSTAATLAETKRESVADPGTSQVAQSPSPHAPGGGRPEQRGLVVANLSVERMEVLVDGSVLGEVAPGHSDTFPLAAGENAVQVRAAGRTSAVRGVRLRAGTTSRMAFDVPRDGSVPEPVQRVTFDGGRGWSAVPPALGVAFMGACVVVLVLLVPLELAGQLTEPGWSPPLVWTVLLSSAAGLGLGARAWSGARPAVRLTLDSQGVVFLLHDTERKTVRWDDIERISVVGDGPDADIVLWPGRDGLGLRGRGVRGGIAVYRARHVGAGAPRDLRRLRAALRWFAGGSYVERSR
ncbi:protein kinase domain-containing protein [Nocardiopsis synnemataformans]|uniref:serine/threonine-protein kinase n=1 Tax=Nocardiopsis synnemataformans TaxID=61305 RepID=UPI003EBA5096